MKNQMLFSILVIVATALLLLNIYYVIAIFIL